MGLKFKDGIRAKLWLKLWFKSDWYSCNNEWEWFFKVYCPEAKFQTITSQSQFEKSNCLEVHCGIRTVVSNLMIKHQLLHTRFDQICDHRHDIYLYGKLSSKLTQTGDQNTEFMLTKTGQFFFSLVWFWKWVSVKIPNKHFWSVSECHWSEAPEFWKATSNHQVNKYWVYLLFLI